MKNLILIVFTVLVTFNVSSQIINFPDANFKAKLLSPTGYGITYHNGNAFKLDVNNDGEIEVSEALLVTSLAISDSNISDLTGLEYFTNIEHFNCNDNSIEELDLTPLTKMVGFDANNNNISSINVSGLVDLHNMGVFNNQLKFLNINGLHSLAVVRCENNQLSSLNLDDTPKLNYIYCQNNLITTLDTSYLTNLRYLDCSFNNLETLYIKNDSGENLNFSDNENLKYICADGFQLMDVEDKIIQYGYTNCFANSICSFFDGENFYTISGHVAYDENSDGCDLADIDYKELILSFSDGINTGTALVDSSGNYHYNVQAGDYTVTPLLSNTNYFNISPNTVVVSFPTDRSPNIQDFCISPNGVFPDLEVSIIDIDRGYDYTATYKIIYKNKGTMTQSGSIDLSFDDDIIDLDFSVPSVSNQSTGQLVWSFIDLLPFETREITYKLIFNSFNDTPPVNSGDLLSFTTIISSDLTDETPVDNTFVLNQEFMCCLLNTPDYIFSDYFYQYPNPTSDFLNLKKEKQIDVKSITVFNLLGQEVKRIIFKDRLIKIDVSNLESGHYFLKIVTSKKVFLSRFIKK